MPKQTFINLVSEKKVKITNALIKHFSLLPYSKVDIADIAKECHVAKGSMYQYFENKKDMYFYAVDTAFKHSLTLIEIININHLSIFEYFENSTEYSFNFIKQYPHSYMLLERAFFHPEAPFRDEVYQKYLSKTRSVLEEMVIINQREGYIRDDIPIDLIILFLEGVSIRIKQNFIEKLIRENLSIENVSIDEIKQLSHYINLLLKEGLTKRRDGSDSIVEPK